SVAYAEQPATKPPVPAHDERQRDGERPDDRPGRRHGRGAGRVDRHRVHGVAAAAGLADGGDGAVRGERRLRRLEHVRGRRPHGVLRSVPLPPTPSPTEWERGNRPVRLPSPTRWGCGETGAHGGGEGAGGGGSYYATFDSRVPNRHERAYACCWASRASRRMPSAWSLSAATRSSISAGTSRTAAGSWPACSS